MIRIRIGRPEWTFAALLLAWLLLWLLGFTGGLMLVLKVAVWAFGSWFFIRLARTLVHHILWRLRNRLIVAYIFIALVPVVLITLLAGLGAVLVGGQLSVYLVTAELERRGSGLRSAIEFLAGANAQERSGFAQTAGPVLNARNPGLHLVIHDESLWTYPADSSVARPSPDWKPGSGLVLRDGKLFGWAYAERPGRQVLATFPITREFLGTLAPDMCESLILNLESGEVLLQSGLPDSPVSHNRLPPAVNRFDMEIRWGSPVPVHLWEHPDRMDHEWLTVRTRPSAMLRTIFGQKVDWASELIPMLFFSVAILFLIAEIISLVIGVSLTRTITGAVHDLYEGTLRVRTSDFRHRIPIHGTDQLAELAGSFNQMTENMERLLAVEKERERLHAELEIAREVQNQLYPRTLPAMQTLQVTAACNPARMVSGDYYDYQQIESDKLAIALGDVAGKGISAALLMATVQSSFRSQLRASADLAVAAGDHRTRVSLSTSTLVSHLNQQLYADTSPEKYATFYAGVYDEATDTLTYTNAGHLPPILLHDGEISRLDVNGTVVGAFPFAKYDESKVQLSSGDMVVFYTDGITEPENEYGEMFGEDRLIDIVLRNIHKPDAEIITSVVDSVRQWTGSDELQDDMTLLLVRKR